MCIKNREIIRKLLRDKLSQEEKDMLLDSKPVNRYLLNQWDESAGIVLSDCPDKDILWVHIRKRTIDKPQTKRIYRYTPFRAAAAIVLFIMGTISLFHILSVGDKGKSEMIYIVNSGIKCMDSITLSDGSQILIGANSRLTYPEKFSEIKREVILDGQGFFNIVGDEKSPFVVHTNQMDITVLGTSFEIYNYDNDSIVETILVNGTVSVTFPSLKDTITMSKNKKLTFNKMAKTVKIETVDADKYSAWRKEGNLSFENEKLTTIIPRLRQWFGSEIECNSIDTENYRFTFKVKDESLERILFIIGKSSPIKHKKEGGKYKLYVTN